MPCLGGNVLILKQTKLLLLKCVRQNKSHFAGHKNDGELFKKLLERFNSNVTVKEWKHFQKCTAKTLVDKLRFLMLELKSDNGTNAFSYKRNWDK